MPYSGDSKRRTPAPDAPGAAVFVGEGGCGVSVDRSDADVGGTTVSVGGTGVSVGGTGVSMGGTGVSVAGMGVAVGGAGVAVGSVGLGVLVGVGVGDGLPPQPAASTTISAMMVRAMMTPLCGRCKPARCLLIYSLLFSAWETWL